VSGREVKRVALDFDYPLNELWKGYVNPYKNKICPYCGGLGYGNFALMLESAWFDFDGCIGNRTERTAYKDKYGRTKYIHDKSLQYNLTQFMVDALVEGGRLWQLTKDNHHPTSEEVNKWAIEDPTGHDAINRSIVIDAICKRLDIDIHCPVCHGCGRVFESDEIHTKYDNWYEQERYDPPSGDGWQLWETVDEGRPYSPVFKTPEELANYCAENCTTFANIKASAEEWLKMIKEDSIYATNPNNPNIIYA
jgi:hypothetical protein